MIDAALAPSPLQVGVFVGVTVSMGALLLNAKRASARERIRTRLLHVTDAAEALKSTDRSGARDGTRRRRRLRDILRELERRSKTGSNRPNLHLRLRQAGLDWSRRFYTLVCILLGVACTASFIATGIATLPSLGFGIALGLLIPHLYVSQRRSRRFANFVLEFPNAIEMIVRGVRAGLPLSDCLRTISTEASSPVREEFALVLRDQMLGLPVDEAVTRLAERIPLPETTFFSIVIAMQSRSGGNLSEVLQNLSRVLRGRKMLAAKIRSMSAEAKASAWIIGSLPPLVAAALYLVRPEYMEVLFQTSTGRIAITGAAIWMLMGILVMRQMTRIEV
jgi:tight adherence protein B